MKSLRKITTLALSLVFALGCFAFASCGDKDKTYTAYEFVVQNADGSAVTEGYVQLCVVEEDGELGSCLQPVAIEDGKVVYTLVTTPGLYEAHVLDASYTQVELAEHVVTSATEFGEYTLTLK